MRAGSGWGRCSVPLGLAQRRHAGGGGAGSCRAPALQARRRPTCHRQLQRAHIELPLELERIGELPVVSDVEGQSKQARAASGRWGRGRGDGGWGRRTGRRRRDGRELFGRRVVLVLKIHAVPGPGTTGAVVLCGRRNRGEACVGRSCWPPAASAPGIERALHTLHTACHCSRARPTSPHAPAGAGRDVEGSRPPRRSITHAQPLLHHANTPRVTAPASSTRVDCAAVEPITPGNRRGSATGGGAPPCHPGPARFNRIARRSRRRTRDAAVPRKPGEIPGALSLAGWRRGLPPVKPEMPVSAQQGSSRSGPRWESCCTGRARTTASTSALPRALPAGGRPVRRAHAQHAAPGPLLLRGRLGAGGPPLQQLRELPAGAAPRNPQPCPAPSRTARTQVPDERRLPRPAPSQRRSRRSWTPWSGS